MFAVLWGLKSNSNHSESADQEREMQSSSEDFSFSVAQRKLKLQSSDEEMYDFIMDQSEAFTTIIKSNNKVDITRPVYHATHDMNWDEANAFERQTQSEPYKHTIEAVVKKLIIRIVGLEFEQFPTLELHKIKLTQKQFKVFELALNVFLDQYKIEAETNLTWKEKLCYNIPETVKIYINQQRGHVIAPAQTANSSLHKLTLDQ
jgi:hypothetical protein